MGAYQKVIVGTDGSDTSMLAVDKAAAIAGNASAELVIVCAYEPQRPEEVNAAAEALGADSYQVVGSAPAESVLRDAADRARGVGATKIETVAVEGDPVDALTDEALRRGVDLLVVGNRGLNSLAGRLLGSVPANITHKANCDVLVVHTTGKGVPPE